MKTRRMKRISQSPVGEKGENRNEKLNDTMSNGKRQKLEGCNNSSKSTAQAENKCKVEEDSSDSSSDEFLRPSQSLDLNSDFFKSKNEDLEFASIEKNIFSDVQRLSDTDHSNSNDDDTSMEDHDKLEVKKASPSSMKPKGNKNISVPSKEVLDDRSLSKSKKTKSATNSRKQHSVAKQSKPDVGSKMKKLPQNSHEDLRVNASDINKMDVSELLAWGESQESNIKVKNTSHLLSDSENDLSDWEEVKENDTTIVKPHTFPKEGVQVTVPIPELKQRCNKRHFDMEAYLKRKLNRVKREMQVLVHKVHLLCWIAHGRYVNSVLNSETLMGLSLSMIPSQYCYPPNRADIRYLEQILKWFNKIIPIEEDTSETKDTSTPLHLSLQKQFETNVAKSQRDLVLMFICLLRSLGVNARLIISLQPVPLKPPNHELCDVSKKKASQSDSSKADDVPNKSNQGNKSKKVQPSPKKKGTKALGVEEAKVIRKRNVMSKEEAINRIKGGTKSPNREADTKTCKQNAEVIENKDKPNRSLRVRKLKVIKYKEMSGSSDEDISTNDKSNTTKDQEENMHDGSNTSANKATGKKNSKTKLKSKTNLQQLNNSKIIQGRTEMNADESVEKPSREETNCKNDSDSDFQPESLIHKRSKGGGKKDVDRRVLSSDTDEEIIPKKRGCDVWAEVYLEAEETWISVDVSRQKVHCVKELYAHATKPVTYVLAWNTDSTLKDVTKRYCHQFHTVTRKQRVDETWWKRSLWPFISTSTARDRAEEEDIERQLQDRPLPTSIGEYKDHPLYVLPRHLLKFQAIYPPDAPTVGFIRKEPVYPRECVHTLHSREVWVKEAKVVRLGEQPYKIVKARPKYDKMSGQFVSDLPLELFGSWQVEDYVPPVAENGRVPRNPYGNVELFKPCMLPKGTVHLQLPCLNRIARKLQIDCASAMIGFDYHSGSSHPVFDGFVVCEEFKDVLLDAWTKEQEEAERREQEKRDKRVYGNWRRLIKGLLIRERLKMKYSFGEAEASTSKCKRSKKAKSMP